MKTLREYVQEAQQKKIAIGHFNISNSDGLWGVFRGAWSLSETNGGSTEGSISKVPVIVGVSEGERDFVGVRQIRALVTSIREEFDYPIFLNADHTYSFEKVKEVIDAGFDSVIFDGTQLSFEENKTVTAHCVEYARASGRDVLIEGELGYIGRSSKVLDRVPEDVDLTLSALTTPDEAVEFVTATGIDMLAPAVGNLHGMLKTGMDPKLNTDRIRGIANAIGNKIPLVLHGGSGNSDDDFKTSIANGVAIIHVNTELRLAYKQGITKFLSENPDEIAPYKFLRQGVQNVQDVVTKKLKVFNNL